VGERLDKVRLTAEPVLLLGPRGSGKTTLARAIHDQSGRRGEFIPVSAPALNEGLAYASLVGHDEGAFTDAKFARKGSLELASTGTLFIEELAVASAAVQALLLDVLTIKCVRRIGEERTRPVDVRVIAATNADLVALSLSGTFREDLLDRFGFLEVRLPPLARQRTTLLAWARHFAAQACVTHEFPWVPTFTPGAEAILMAYEWPGNLRQLQKACSFAVLMAHPRSLVDACHLPAAVRRAVARISRQPAPDRAERLQQELQACRGNISEAARRMGISRSTAHRWLARLGSKPPAPVTDGVARDSGAT
jgi:DNA-binding NtrC family response regulator